MDPSYVSNPYGRFLLCVCIGGREESDVTNVQSTPIPTNFPFITLQYCIQRKVVAYKWISLDHIMQTTLHQFHNHKNLKMAPSVIILHQVRSLEIKKSINSYIHS